MLKFKKDVPISGLQPEALDGIDICNAVFNSFGEDCIVTSTTDGDHMIGSLHYKGLAWDMRVWHVGDKEDEIDAALRCALPDTYDVLLERSPEHWHCEFDPK